MIQRFDLKIYNGDGWQAVPLDETGRYKLTYFEAPDDSPEREIILEPEERVRTIFKQIKPEHILYFQTDKQSCPFVRQMSTLRRMIEALKTAVWHYEDPVRAYLYHNFESGFR